MKSSDRFVVNALFNELNELKSNLWHVETTLSEQEKSGFYQLYFGRHIKFPISYLEPLKDYLKEQIELKKSKISEYGIEFDD